MLVRFAFPRATANGNAAAEITYSRRTDIAESAYCANALAWSVLICGWPNNIVVRTVWRKKVRPRIQLSGLHPDRCLRSRVKLAGRRATGMSQP